MKWTEILIQREREREREREQIIKKGKIPWYGQLIYGIIFLASVFFLIIPAAVAVSQQIWGTFGVCIVLFVIINAACILVINNTKTGKRYKKLGQEIKKLKNKLEYLKIKARKEQD